MNTNTNTDTIERAVNPDNPHLDHWYHPKVTPTKLRSGEWGAKMVGRPARPGDIVTITARSGKSWDARIGKVLWEGKDDEGRHVSIFTTRSAGRRSSDRWADDDCPTGGDCWSFAHIRHCHSCGK